MGELILCKTSMAASSWYIEEASLNIYSLEELCYYIYNNAFLLKEGFVDESLCFWIRDELKLPDLATQLLGLLQNGARLNVVVGHLIRFCGYLTKSEIKKTLEIISSFEGKSEAEIRKLRADHLLTTGRYLDSVFSYEGILDKKLPMDDKLKGAVYHNLGCALSGLFFFEKATVCFEQAYRLNRNQESLDKLLFSCIFSGNEEAFNLYKDRYQVLPEDVGRIRNTYKEAMDNKENRDFVFKLNKNLEAARNEVEREFIYREVIGEYKADYRSLRAF